MVIRKNEYEGSVSMSAREQVLMNKIENLRRFGIDISNSRFKDKDVENFLVVLISGDLNRRLIIRSGLPHLLQLQGLRREPENLESTVFLNHLME